MPPSLRIGGLLLIAFLVAGHVAAAQDEPEHEISSATYGEISVKIKNVKEQPSAYCS